MANIDALRIRHAFPLLFVLALGPIQAHSQIDGSNAYYDQSYSQPELSADRDGVWIVDPSAREPDIPKVGRSLFDLIFSTENGDHTTYDVPFPFPELLQRIREHLAAEEDSLKQVRIPLGRSLRRRAAAPDYFRYPRIVVAADAEPADAPGQAGLLLKRRLFLGYQEKSNVLEVISYNPEAGRFEFQEVRNYGPGMKPRVIYARRALCLSCHQNAGPIFPMEPWRETDANLAVSARLHDSSSNGAMKRAYAPRFDDAWAIDYASDRANYLSSSQFLWREGCGSNGTTSISDSIRCRAAMLSAMLQYRLIGYFDPQSDRYRKAFLPVIRRNWQRRWPGGLYIATADIPDRDPFSPVATSVEDPLTPRPPRAFWSTPNSHLLAGIVYQMADFFAETDMERIDRALYRRAAEAKVPISSYRSVCTFTRTVPDDSTQVFNFSCVPAGNSVEPGFGATGLLIMDNGHVINGNISRLSLSALPELRFLTLGEGSIKDTHEGRSVGVRLKTTNKRLGARLLDGTLLEQIRFRWPEALDQNQSEFTTTAHLTTIRDIAPLDEAIERIVVATVAGKTDALASMPFRRHSILKKLYEHLGVPQLTWRHDGASPPPAGDWQVATHMQSQSFAPFYQHCSACHSAYQRFPPGFLSGTPAAVSQKLSDCAPRILFRLGMWNHQPLERSVSPMPPAHWLSSSGLSEAEWRESESLKELQSVAQQLIVSAASPQPTAEVGTALPLCVP